MENDTEYKNLVNVNGKHTTYDEVATLYGVILMKVLSPGESIPLYLHDGENVDLAIKELE